MKYQHKWWALLAVFGIPALVSYANPDMGLTLFTVGVVLLVSRGIESRLDEIERKIDELG